MSIHAKSSNLSDLYHPVEKIPLSKLLPLVVPPKGKEYVILEEHSKSILHFCSKDYRLRKNETIFKTFQELLIKKKIKFTKIPYILSRTKFYVNFIIHQPIPSNKLSFLLPLMSMWNSYDGTLKTQVQFGYYNQISQTYLCQPMCAIDASAKHSATDEEFINLQIPKFFELYEQFMGKQVKNDVCCFEELYDLPGSIKHLDKVAQKIKLSSITRDLALNHMAKIIDGGHKYTDLVTGKEKISKPEPSSLFIIYNALNFAIFNSNPKEPIETKCKKEKKIMDAVMKISKKVTA